MKPKFRIGDRVKMADGEEFTVGGFYGDGFYNISNEDKSFVGIVEWSLELVGCGIPAPVLRWETGETFTEARVFGIEFRIRSLRNGKRYSVCGEFYEGGYATLEEAKEACQAYWQQLWDKEMLISRDLTVSL